MSSDLKTVIAGLRDVSDMLDGFASTSLPDWLDTHPTNQQLAMALTFVGLYEAQVERMDRAVMDVVRERLGVL